MDRVKKLLVVGRCKVAALFADVAEGKDRMEKMGMTLVLDMVEEKLWVMATGGDEEPDLIDKLLVEDPVINQDKVKKKQGEVMPICSL